VSIDRIGGSAGAPVPGHAGIRRGRPDGAGEVAAAVQVRLQREAATAAGVDDVPAQAPPGTDPVLWGVLTAEERHYFARLQTSGPLTYGPRSANVPPGLVRGGRIDRVV
jgi:hypothetical protein